MHNIFTQKLRLISGATRSIEKLSFYQKLSFFGVHHQSYKPLFIFIFLLTIPLLMLGEISTVRGYFSSEEAISTEEGAFSAQTFRLQVVDGQARQQAVQGQSNHEPLSGIIGNDCRGLITNSGFENGVWHYTRTLSEPGLVQSPTYSGQRAARLGNALNGTNYETHSTLYQTVTIPANATEVVLRFWEQTGQAGDSGDYREVKILDTNFRLLRLLARDRQYTHNQWTYHSFDVTDLRGHTVIVYFNVYNNGVNNSMRTYIDDASLTACGSNIVHPTPTHTPTHTPAPPTGGQWYGEYWNNIELHGHPHLTRYDSAINFDWGEGKPADSIHADDFSVRWTRRPYFSEGNYRFEIQVDDGVRLYVDDQLILDDWRIGSIRTVTADRYLSAGEHTIRLEYYERTERAVVKLNWYTVSEQANAPAPNNNWWGEYFNNVDLSGSPALARHDARVDFSWSTHSPGPHVQADNFSVRWTRRQYFSAGNYRLYARSDDGIRVWVDNHLRIDEWRDRSPETTSVDLYLSEGDHDLRVEYYERTLGAMAQFWSERLSDHAPTPTPTHVPGATATPSPSGIVLRVGSREERGQQFIVVPLEIAGMHSGTNLGSLDVTILYDSTILTASTCTPNSHFDLGICNIEPGKVLLTALSSNGLTGDNTLAELTFKIKERADRSTTLRIEVDELTDKDSRPLHVSRQDGRILFNSSGCNAGDVNCDGRSTISDALFMLQFSVGARGGTHNYPPASDHLFLPSCDVSNDNACTTVDALQVLQCSVDVANHFCPGAGGNVISTMNGSGGMAGTAQVIASAATSDANGQIRVPVTALVNQGNLGALTLQLGYDATKIRVVDCVPDPEELFQGSQCNINFGTGNKIRLATVDDSGVSGQVTLAELVVEPLDENSDEDVVLQVEVIEAASNLSQPMLVGEKITVHYLPLIMR